jgi:uncharacterized protein YbcC (UPF0753/DUF2309 family)
MPTEFYREAWQGGRIRREDLQASIAERGDVQNTAWYLDWLGRAPSTRAPLKSSILDTYRLASGDDQGGLADTACDQVSRVCGAFFDQRQGRWSAVDDSPETGLFQFWLESVRSDLSLDFSTGLKGARAFFKSVPDKMDEAIPDALNRIGVFGEELEALCHSLLLKVNGWASWCRGEDWRVRGDTGHHAGMGIRRCCLCNNGPESRVAEAKSTGASQRRRRHSHEALGVATCL